MSCASPGQLNEFDFQRTPKKQTRVSFHDENQLEDVPEANQWIERDTTFTRNDTSQRKPSGIMRLFSTKEPPDSRRRFPSQSIKYTGDKNVKMRILDCLLPRVKQTRRWPPRYHFRDILFASFTWFAFAVDYATDIKLMTEYYVDGEMTSFALTLTFIVVPAIITSIISILWYHQTFKRNIEEYETKIGDSPVRAKWKEKQRRHSHKLFVVRFIFSLLQLGRIFRQMEYILSICRSFCLQHRIKKAPEEAKKDLKRKNRNLRRHAIFEKRDAAMLGLVDSFLESAMQLLLQLYLAITSSLPLTFSRVSSLCASLLATSLTHSAFYRVNRKANKTRKTVPYFSSFCYFLARISELSPRYLLLSLTCSYFLPWCLIAVPFHIGFVFLLYYYFKPNLKGICPNMKNMACMSRCDFLNKLFILMMSYIGLFSFINLVEGKSKKPAAIFYFVFYFENLLMTSIILWYSVSNKAVTWWTYTLWSVPIGIVCHVVFLSVFYECLHPNKRAESSVFQNEERTRISEY